MRKLNTSAITTSIAMPVKSGTWDHLQAAYTETISELVKGMAGPGYSDSTMYILNGLVNSSSHPTYNLSAGSVFFNGEVYLVDAVNFTVSGPNQAVCKVVTTQFSGINADGVQFTDGVTRNIHDIRKVQVVADLGGSGISNYLDGQRIYANIPPVNLINGAGINITGTYPNKTINSTITNKIIRTGKIQIGDLNTAPTDPNTALLAGSTNGLSAYLHTFPSALADANYKPILMLGNDGHNDWGGFNNNFMCVVQTGAYDANQMYFAIGTTASGNAQAIDINYVLVSTV